MDVITLDDPQDFLKYRKGSGDTIEIYDIAVGTDRRVGKGRRLVELLLANIPPGIRTIWAITRAENFIAQQFYENLGFRVIAPLRNFYRDGPDTVDAIMYGRDI